MLGHEVCNALKLVRDADQYRTSPLTTCAQVLEAAIVETKAAAEARAFVIDGEKRKEDEVELPDCDASVSDAYRFENAETICPELPSLVIANELHLRTPVVGDDRKVDAAAPSSGQLHDR